MRIWAYLRSIGRRIGLAAAKFGLLGQVLSGMVVGLPMLTLVPTRAKAAVQCSDAPPNYLALYTSGATAMSRVFVGDLGSVYCSGMTPGTIYSGCFSSGTTSTYGNNLQTATSASGNTVKYKMSLSHDVNGFNDGYLTIHTGAGNSGTISFWNDYVYISVPQQTVPIGDYIGSYNITVNILQGGTCAASMVGTYTIPMHIVIRVGGSCLLGTASGVDLGNLVADASGNITINNGFTNISAACTVGTPFNIALSNGNFPSGDTTYRWQMASGGSRVKYGFFTDNARTVVPVGGVNYTGTGGASAIIQSNSVIYYAHATFTVYIAPNQPISAIQPGTYTDVVIVTMTW